MSPAIVIPLTVVGTGTAALLGYLLYERLKAPSSGGSNLQVPASLQPPPGDVPPRYSPGGGGGYAPPPDDVPMSARVRQHLDNLLRAGRDPDALEIVAQTLDGLGYAGEAGEVRSKEAQLKGVSQDPTRASVTTHDPAPAGDLAIYASPGGALVGGAEKDHVVTILRWDVDGTGQWAQVQWIGGARRPPATGYAHRAYLVPADVYAGVRNNAQAAGFGNSPMRATRASDSNFAWTQGSPMQPPPVAGWTFVESNLFPQFNPPGWYALYMSPATSAAPAPGGAFVFTGPDPTRMHAQHSASGVRMFWLRYSDASGRPTPAVSHDVARARVGNLRNVTRPPGRDAKFERYMARKAAFGAMHDAGESHVRDGKVRWPGGLRLRAEPQQAARTMMLVPAASSVHVLRQVQGPKIEPSAPGPGGWSEINWMGRRGWVPSEWIA